MRAKRTVAFALAGLMFAVALYLHMTYVVMFGFWDGFASELDRAENMLARYFIWFSLAMGVWFIGIGFWRSHPNFTRRVLYSCLLFAFAAGVAVSLDLYFRTYMMDSAGG
jgi:vacuolar-type H+-ATPase subunit I/STV1